MAAAVVITLAAHLLPTIANTRAQGGRVAVWALWAACMGLTVYGHVVFFASAAAHAGSSRAATEQETEHSRALREQLASITARALAPVSADLAAAQQRHANATQQLTSCERQASACTARRSAVQQTQQQVEVLRVERAEAQRAADLRAQLATAAAGLDTRRNNAAADPVGAQLASLTGSGAEAVPLGVAVLSSIVVELLAALLWAEALRTPAANTAAPDPLPNTDSAVAHLVSPSPETLRTPVSAMTARRVRPQSGAPPRPAAAT